MNELDIPSRQSKKAWIETNMELSRIVKENSYLLAKCEAIEKTSAEAIKAARVAAESVLELNKSQASMIFDLNARIVEMRDAIQFALDEAEYESPGAAKSIEAPLRRAILWTKTK